MAIPGFQIKSFGSVVKITVTCRQRPKSGNILNQALLRPVTHPIAIIPLTNAYVPFKHYHPLLGHNDIDLPSLSLYLGPLH